MMVPVRVFSKAHFHFALLVGTEGCRADVIVNRVSQRVRVERVMSVDVDPAMVPIGESLAKHIRRKARENGATPRAARLLGMASPITGGNLA